MNAWAKANSACWALCPTRFSYLLRVQLSVADSQKYIIGHGDDNVCTILDSCK